MYKWSTLDGKLVPTCTNPKDEIVTIYHQLLLTIKVSCRHVGAVHDWFGDFGAVLQSRQLPAGFR